MKPNVALACVLVAPLFLTGCPKTTIDKTNQDKPKTDYVFSEAKRDELMQERKPISEAMSLQFNGERYEQINYVHQEENAQFFELESHAGKVMTLMLPNGKNKDAQCVVYRKNRGVDMFNCAKSRFSVSDQTHVLPTTVTSGQNVVILEFENQLLEAGVVMGSTRFTPNYVNNKLNFTTEFAFKDFYNDLICDDNCTDLPGSTLGVSSFLALEALAEDYVLKDASIVINNAIDGSVDDEINVYTGLFIREHKMHTHITKLGSVASGGTDLFAAGITRTLDIANNKISVEKNKQIGVHSWADGDKSASDYPYSHTSHHQLASYSHTMLGAKGVDFYLFTINAAPPQGMHYMTKDELTKYQLVTKFNTL